jgi:hypothetical protein
MRLKTLSIWVLAFLAGPFAVSLFGDSRVIPPQITRIWPAGFERGTTATFTIEGRNLSEIKTIVFDAPGIAGKVTQVTDIAEKIMPVRIGVDTSAPVPKGKKQTATVEIAATQDVTAGIHWLRIRTPLGTTNTMAFDVGAFPEVASGSMGADDSQPENVTLPATLVGTIAVPGQADRYEFEGRAGEEVVFQVDASAFGSVLESQLILRDETEKELAQSGQYLNQADAVLTYKLPQAGKYTLAVTDREQTGGEDHFYRVNAGPLPYISHIFPLGVRAGESTNVAVEGVNLGGIHEVKVDAPKSVNGWTTTPLQVKGDGGWSLNTVKLVVGDNPEITEQEPNNSPALAQVVTLPVTINGHISGRDADGAVDEDYFRFHARKGQNLTIDVAAARLGSPLDSQIEILDAQGNPIPRATIRCLYETYVTLSDKDSLRPEVRMVSSSGFHEGDYLMIGDELDRLTFIPDQPDADVGLRNADGLRWPYLGTTPAARPLNTPIYRVEVLPPGAEFPPNGLPIYHLTWRNDDGGPGYGPDSRLDFTAPEDGDYIVHLKDVRGLEGEDFAYRLSLRDPDPDYRLSADPGNPNIPQGGSAFVTVTANRVRGYEGPIDVRVEGLPSGITALPSTIPAGQDSTMVLFSADAKSSVDAAPASFKIVGHAMINGMDHARIASPEMPLMMASVIPPPDAVVTVGPEHVTLAPGQDVKVTLRVDRRDGFAGRVPCTVRNLPPGVRVVNIGLSGVLVSETQTTRTITLHADDWAKPITQPIYIVGLVESNSPTLHPSAPLTVEVVSEKESASINPNPEGASKPADGDGHSPKP